MFSTLAVVLYLSSYASVVAQSSVPVSVVCVAGQCLQGFSNTTIGARLSGTGASSSLQLLPGQYTSTTNPQLLHSLLTSSTSTLATSPGFSSASLSSLPLNLQLDPGLAIYAETLYSGQSAFSQLPSSPILNSSTDLGASSLALSNNVWAAVTSGSSSDRIVLWDAVPDVSQLPSSASSSLSLLDIQSASCSPPCSGSGVCSASGTCTCPTGFTGSSCETCGEGFFGPTCQACPSGCATCDQGISGSGRCLTPVVTNAPSTCNCLNGQCGSTGQCVCNPGWAAADNGTACAKCATGFFLSTTGECQVCQLGCTQCADGTATCISCKQGFTQDANDKTKCNPLPSATTTGTKCPDGSFSTGAECATCSPSCRTCTGATSNDCVLCASGTYLFNGNCVGTDTSGVCQGTNGMIADNNKNECDTCGAKCTSCKIPNFSAASTVNQLQCTGCLPGFVLSQGSCVESCPAGSFVSPQDNLTCIPCSSSCSTCAGTADFCLTCAGGQLASSGQCVSTCPSNTFSSASTTGSTTAGGSCLKCHPDCASCSGPSFSQCSSCPSSRPVLTSGRCLPTCTKSQFFDKTSSSCQSCDSSCSSCVGAGPSNCLACSSSTQVLRGGSCIAANCDGSSNVIPGLGVCLSELVEVPKASGTGTAAPLPSITGLSDPTVITTKRPLEWWEILLMALGCAFIFVIILMCWRRRARNQREKRTKMFATAKQLDNPRGWRWRLARFGERLFGSKKTKPELPVAYNHHSHSRPQSMISERDIKMDTIPSSKVVSKRETVDDFIDAYGYSTHRTSRTPTTLPGLDRDHDREYSHSERQDYTNRLKKQQQRRIERDSLYSEVTGNQRHTPEPRQPLRREPSAASRFTRSSASSSSYVLPSYATREGVLVDLDDQSDHRILPLPPLQMVHSGPATEAQAYVMSVRPDLTGQQMTMPQQHQPGPVPTFAIAPPPQMLGNVQTGGSFLPIPVTLTPNTTGGQGSYWLTQQQMQLQMPSVDTVVLQPMHTGGSSRNPFRQGSS